MTFREEKKAENHIIYQYCMCMYIYIYMYSAYRHQCLQTNLEPWNVDICVYFLLDYGSDLGWLPAWRKPICFTSVSCVHSLCIFSHVVVCLLRTWCCWHWVCEQCRAVLRNEDRETLVKYTTQRMNCESTQQSDISTKIWKATWEDNRENKVLKEKGATGNGMEPLHPFCWPKYQLAARSLFTTKVLLLLGFCRNWWQKPTKT